jgi:hypothetical protein
MRQWAKGLQNFALHGADSLVVVIVARKTKLEIAIGQPNQEEG